MNRLIKAGEAPKILGVIIQTPRRQEKTRQLLSDKKTERGTRYYNIDRLLGAATAKESTLTYTSPRVSNQDQKADLQRQKEVLSAYCTVHGWNSVDTPLKQIYAKRSMIVGL